MYGKDIWKNSNLILALEAKGKKVEVGTTKIYPAKDKKYAGQEKYHVYLKTDQPGKKAWKYIGTVGSKTGKADNHLKELGIEVKDGKPVGMEGGTMMIPPPDAGEKAPEKPEPVPEPTPDPTPEPTPAPEPEAKLPEPDKDVTTAEQSEFNHKFKDLHQFIGDVDDATAGISFDKEKMDAIKAKYPDIVAETGGQVMGAWSMADELYIAPGSGGVQGSHLDAEQVYNNWLKTHAGKTGAEMAGQYGENWSKVAWGMAAAISKAKGGPGDTDTPVYKPKKKTAPVAAPMVPALTTASGFKVVPSGKGKKVPDGTTKIQPEKNGKLQVHVKQGKDWVYLGTVGAKKGSKKGAAEAHLKTLGIETDGTKLKGDLDVSKAVALAPAEGAGVTPPGVSKAPEPAVSVPPEKLMDPGFVPAGDTPEGLAKQAAYDTKMAGIVDAAKEYMDAGNNLYGIDKDTKDKWNKKFTIGSDYNGSWLAQVDLANEMQQVAKDAFNPYASDLDNIAAVIVGTTSALGSKNVEDVFGPDWGYKMSAIAKQIVAKKQAVSDEKIAKAQEKYAATPVAPPPKEYAKPSEATKAHYMGFKEMYNIVKEAGGPDNLSAPAKAIFDQHNPDWEKDYNLAASIEKQFEKSGSTTAAMDNAEKHPGSMGKSMSLLHGPDWEEKASEIHKELFGGYPGEAPAPKPTEADTPEPVAPAPEPAPAPAKKKKKKTVQAAPVPPPVSVQEKPGFVAGSASTPAADLPIPPPSGLTLKKGAASGMAGAGEKNIYTDDNGNEFLFKLAKNKAGTAEEPFRAHVQAGFSEVARHIKPIHPKIEVTKLEGTVGAIYPFLPGADKIDLMGQSPSSLSPQEKLDVAEEHVIDWMMSQHDSHAENFLRTADGRIVGIDKEQGFKYFGDDKLSVDYHPNAAYGEKEPFYNKFWREYAEGKNDFDPQQLGAAIEKAMAVPPLALEGALRPYAEQIHPGDTVAQAAFLREAMNRRNTVKRDFEKFITDLTEKKEGVKGSFTFAAGWKVDGEEDKPYEKTTEHPAKTEKAEELFGKLDGHGTGMPNSGYKVVSFMQDGVADPSKVTIKSNKPASEVEADLKKMGIDAKVLSGSSYRVAIVDKAQFDAASAHTPAWTETKTIYPEPKEAAPTPDKPEYMPIVAVPERTVPNSDFLKEITKSTELGYGTGVSLDGPAVEQQRARVTRRKDKDGVYYEVSFKLRASAHESVSGGQSSSFEFKKGTLSKKGDVLSATSTIDTAQARKWESDQGDVHLLKAAGKSSQYAYRGMVVAKLRVPPEEIDGALKGLLDKMQPGLAGKVVRDPSPEEQEVVRLSSALMAVAPQVADKLDADEAAGLVERTPELLKAKLKGKMKKGDLEKLAQLKNGDANAAVHMPGRWRDMGGGDPADPEARFLFWETKHADNMVNQFLTVGAAGINERNLAGITIGSEASSYGSDVNTGCADNMTVRLATKAKGGSAVSGGYGQFKIIVAPDELDRMDPFIHPGDKFGCVNPDYVDSGYAQSFKDRQPLDNLQVRDESSYGKKKLRPVDMRDELVVRKMFPKDKVLRIACTARYGETAEANRQKLIKAFKAKQIFEINGVPIEDFVVASGSVEETYQKYVKPAGY